MRLLSKSAEETRAFGLRLGSMLKGGCTVCLYGELGSGKTVFTKGIASALGIPERDITSASFTIITEYRGNVQDTELPFYHIDLYRIASPGELDSIGIDDYIGTVGISVVEWAERLSWIEDSISVSFKMLDGEKREIAIEGIDEKAWNNM